MQDGRAFYVGLVITYDNARRLLPAIPDHGVLTGKDGTEICPIPVRSMAGQEEAIAKALKMVHYEKLYVESLLCGVYYGHDM